MKLYVCEIDGAFQEVKKTGREAHNRSSLIGSLAEVVVAPSGSGPVIGPTPTSRTKAQWVPMSELFEIGGVEDV